MDERAFAAATVAEGLTVTRPDGSVVPIPVSSVPEVRTDDALRRAAIVAEALARSIASVGRAVLAGRAPDVVLPHLSPLEASLARQTGSDLDLLAVTRTDFFDGDGLRALELNATIPAMQAYGDIAARCWVRARAQALGVDPAPLVAALPSNAHALLSALRGAWNRRRSREPDHLAVLVRRNDAQLTEIRWLIEAWRRAGVDAWLLFPDQVERRGAGFAGCGRALSWVYRHLFVRRLEQIDAAPVREMLAPRDGPVVVVNPPASQLEVKAVLALLSEALTDERAADALGVEVDLLKGAVPWTRVLRPGPGTGVDGERLEDLVAHVSAHPDRFVVKRSWDYGGRAVFVGPARDGEGFEERVRSTFGVSMDWSALVARCASEGPAAWIAQEAVTPRRARHRLCTSDGTTETDLFVDLSHYASVGLDPQPAWSGVVRGSTSAVVNIVGGGGVLPLVPEQIATALGVPPE